MKRLMKNPNAVAGMVILAVILAVGLFTEVIAPYGYAEINMADRLQGPSLRHFFGTDEMGRDLFSRIIYGTRSTLMISFGTVAFGTGIGIILGSAAGYFGGRADNIIMRFLDVISAIPGILLAICISAVLGNGMVPTIAALGVGGVAGAARILRASMISIREQEYVEAAVSINAGNLRIIAKHVFPNAMSPLIISASMSLANAIIVASSLSFIGLGIQPPNPEWGALLAAGRNMIRDYPHLVMFPGVMIMITVLAMNLFGDALRDALDPKLKR
ncbi:ABC transporter permease [Hungatella hathewayi]|nr:ABC transporter permease subunit [Hungatella hathewayi]MUB65156.1 ABC transporter permease subunit [Hungatella hathewayi]RGZ06085.1 ABC transporter permease [Hungatella hathewayi]CUP77040.1 glutathione transport system permease protein GsiD [Hungatella hathewayi]